MPDGVGEGYEAMQATPPLGPRAVFTGAESLAAVAEQAKAANAAAGRPPCAACFLKEGTIAARVADIGKLKLELETAHERLIEQANVLSQVSTSAEVSRARDTIARLQATDVVQRRDLDFCYTRLNQLMATMMFHGVPVPEELPRGKSSGGPSGD